VPLRPLATLAAATALFLLTVSEKPSRADDGAYDPHKIMLAKGRFEKGMKFLEEGKEAEGKMELDEALKLFPDYADAEIQLGNLSMRRRNYSEGLAHYLQAEAALSHLQGIARLREVERRKRIQESIDVVQERIEGLRHSNRAGDSAGIGQEMVKLEKLRQEQTKVLPPEGNPFPAELHFLTGNARMNLEKYDEAIQDYGQALALRPNYGEVHNNLAVIYLYRKDYARAWDHLHSAEKAGVRINPQFREELAALAPEPSQPSGP